MILVPFLFVILVMVGKGLNTEAKFPVDSEHPFVSLFSLLSSLNKSLILRVIFG